MGAELRPEGTDQLTTSAFAFASDLADEGVEAVLRNIHERAGLEGITPAFVYHAARDIFPHNPKRKVHLLDHGEHFFPPDPTLYEGLRIQPRVNPAVLAHDVLGETCREAADRGLRVHAWTVFLHADRHDDNPDCCTRNAFGDPYPADLCPANPDVRAYVRALVSDVGRYDVETILAESVHYHGLEHGHHHERYFVDMGARARYLLGLCFCEHCLARARQAAVDAEAVRSAIRLELEGVFADRRLAGDGELEPTALDDIAGGELAAYLDMRAEAVTTLVAEAAEVAAGRDTRLVFLDPSGAVKGYTSGRPTGGPAAEGSWRQGIDLTGIARVCPEIEVLGYAADTARIGVDLDAYREHLADVPVSLALRPSPPDCESPENLASKIRLARAAGVRRVDFYHYGFVRLEALEWIRSALEA
jgi:hypothetical protein